MMRVSSVEQILSQIADEDIAFFRHLAEVRGAFTVRDFAVERCVQRPTSCKTLNREPYSLLLKKTRISDRTHLPEMYYLARRIGRRFYDGYQEPKTPNTLLDSYLRFQGACKIKSSVWQHHLKLPSLQLQDQKAFIFDCLDRREISVIKFCEKQARDHEVILFTASKVRAKRFEILLDRRGQKSVSMQIPTPSPSWEKVFSESSQDRKEIEFEPLSFKVKCLELGSLNQIVDQYT
jgi:hypothetical protein